MATCPSLMNRFASVSWPAGCLFAGPVVVVGACGGTLCNDTAYAVAFDDVARGPDRWRTRHGGNVMAAVRGKPHIHGNISRHAVNFAAKLHSQTRGDERAGILGPLHHHHAERYSRDDAVAYREIFGRGMRAQREFADQRAAFSPMEIHR